MIIINIRNSKAVFIDPPTDTETVFSSNEVVDNDLLFLKVSVTIIRYQIRKA